MSRNQHYNLFMQARRGEDGDQTKTRRILKPSKPKVFNRMEGQFVSYVSLFS